jgi:lipoprotein signal peptidase
MSDPGNTGRMLSKLIPGLRSFVRHEVLRRATLIAIAAFLADWATKSWALQALHDVDIPLGALTLGVHRNDAFAFSSGAGMVAPEIVVAVRVFALIAVVYLARRIVLTSARYATGVALVLAGGFGNAADLVFRGGAVIDFIGAGPFTFTWGGELIHLGFVFNAADIAIFVGLGLIAPQIQLWARDKQRRLAQWEARMLKRFYFGKRSVETADAGDSPA